MVERKFELDFPEYKLFGVIDNNFKLAIPKGYGYGIQATSLVEE